MIEVKLEFSRNEAFYKSDDDILKRHIEELKVEIRALKHQLAHIVTEATEKNQFQQEIISRELIGIVPKSTGTLTQADVEQIITESWNRNL